MLRTFQTPFLSRDWKTLVLLGIAIFFISFCTRLFDYPNWEAGKYRIEGEWIMGTHDAYYWLAGAEGRGPANNTAPSVFLKTMSQLSGASLGNTAFWLPALMAGFTGVATLLWAWTLGCVEAGVLAGILTVLAPGFLYRTRLGYYDTDMVTLLFPLLASWSLAAWMRPYLQSRWRFSFSRVHNKESNAEQAAEPQQIPGTIEYLLLSTAGAAAGAFSSWHAHIGAFTIVLILLALLLGGLQSRPYVRPRLFFGLLLFSLGSFAGLAGACTALVAVAALAILRSHIHRLFAYSWPFVLGVLLLLLFSGAAAKAGFETERFLFTFVKTTTQQTQPEFALQDTPRQELSYPAIGQSIVEAQSISLTHILKRMHPRPWIPIAGLFGFAFLLYAQPVSLFLLPLVLFSFTAEQFGARVTMFGAPAVMLGLGIGIGSLGRAAFESVFKKRNTLLALMSLLFLLLAIPYYNLLQNLAPTPVLSKAHAAALVDLGRTSPPDSEVWTWWDWGYPVDYYARRESFADGSKHLGQHIFTVGLALSTHSPLQASQLIRFSAQEHYRPWESLNQLGPEGAERFLADLGKEPRAFRVDQPQYLVVTTENLPLAPWILFYGTWNFLSENGKRARVMRFLPPYEVDYESGWIHLERADKSYSVRTIDVLRKEGTKRFHFPDNTESLHLVLCPETADYFLVDTLTYESMLVRLLVEPPDSADIASFFRLAYEKKPAVRIFEVLGRSE